MIKTIIQWFLYSSNNPQTISTTIKAGGVLLVTMGFGSFMGTYDEGAGLVMNWIVYIGQFLALCSTTHAFMRKVWSLFAHKQA